MRRFLIRFAAILSALCMCTALCPQAAFASADPTVVTTNATAGWPQAEDINSTAGVLIEASTGTVLFNKAMDQQMYPASITKVLTTLVVLENGNLSDPVTMTQTGLRNLQVDRKGRMRHFKLVDILKRAVRLLDIHARLRSIGIGACSARYLPSYIFL